MARRVHVQPELRVEERERCSRAAQRPSGCADLTATAMLLGVGGSASTRSTVASDRAYEIGRRATRAVVTSLVGTVKVNPGAPRTEGPCVLEARADANATGLLVWTLGHLHVCMCSVRP